jgi:hypothetical protein
MDLKNGDTTEILARNMKQIPRKYVNNITTTGEHRIQETLKVSFIII